MAGSVSQCQPRPSSYLQESPFPSLIYVTERASNYKQFQVSNFDEIKTQYPEIEIHNTSSSQVPVHMRHDSAKSIKSQGAFGLYSIRYSSCSPSRGRHTYIRPQCWSLADCWLCTCSHRPFWAQYRGTQGSSATSHDTVEGLHTYLREAEKKKIAYTMLLW